LAAGLNRTSLVGKYHRLPEPARIAGTAAIGLVIALITYEIIFAINPFEPRASISWLVAFLIGVARQHALHRWLTFTQHVAYWPSLGRAYVMDAASVIIGTGLNWLLTEPWGVNHRLAWLACMATIAVFNFVLLKRYVFRA
jgi:putative flippase GtrA